MDDPILAGGTEEIVQRFSLRAQERCAELSPRASSDPTLHDELGFPRLQVRDALRPLREHRIATRFPKR